MAANETNAEQQAVRPSVLSLTIRDKSALFAAYTPVGAQGNRAAGIGIQFKDSDTHEARTKIESLLGSALKSERQTHTM